MLRHLFFVMSLSGSVIVLLYKIVFPFAGRHFPHSWSAIVLRMALFFYLVPVPMFKDLALSRVREHFPLPFELFEASELWTVDPEYTVNLQDRRFFLGVGVLLAYVFAACMAVAVTVVIVKQLKQYYTIRHSYLLDDFTEEPSPQLEEWLREGKEELQIKGKVRIVCSRLCDAPITIGVLSPVIIFPVPEKLDLEPTDHQYILKHELIHVKNKDLLVKFLGLLALVVHWYDPICYLLYHELCVVSELDCDYGVVNGIDDAQRQRYSRLILDLAAAGSGKKERFAVGLVNNDTATFERRILAMKQTRKKSKPVLSCLVMAVICVLGTITAFAYQAPVMIETEDVWMDYDAVAFAGHGSANGESLLYDYYFVDKNGEITSLENVSPRLFCKHNFIEGYVYKHKKYDDGSSIWQPAPPPSTTGSSMCISFCCPGA